MKNLKHTLVALTLWTLAWFGLIQPVTWIANLFAFITWASLFLFFFGNASKAMRETIIKTHRDGKHAPEWFDWITYLTIVFICAAAGHYGKACAWTFMMSVDLGHRKLSKEKSKPAVDTQESV